MLNKTNYSSWPHFDINGDSYPELERSSLTIYHLCTCIYVCNTYLNIIYEINEGSVLDVVNSIVFC